MHKAERYMNVMLCVLMADGRVEDEERELFLDMLASVGLREDLVQQYRDYFLHSSAIDTETMLGDAVSGVDAETLAWIAEDAYVMADVDGCISPEEITMINRFLQRAGVPPERLEDVRDWGLESLDLQKRGQALFASILEDRAT